MQFAISEGKVEVIDLHELETLPNLSIIFWIIEVGYHNLEQSFVGPRCLVVSVHVRYLLKDSQPVG